VVGEAQVHAAAVDVEVVAEVLAGHGRALDVPTGTAAAPRRGPGRSARLGGRLPSLPQGEVAGVALAARVRVGRGLHVLDLLPGQGAVVGERAHVEVDVAGAVLGRIGVAPLDEGLDELDHLGDVTGRRGLVGRRCDV